MKRIIFISIITLSAIISLFVWSGLAYYLYLLEGADGIKSLSYDQLGTAGDYFNIATSLSSVITVILISYGVYLQKEELSEVRAQIERQISAVEKSETINRTITLISEWSAILARPDEDLYKKNTYEDTASIELGGHIDIFIKKLTYINDDKTMSHLIDIKTIVDIVNSDNIREKYQNLLFYYEYKDDELQDSLENKIITKESYNRQKKIYPKISSVINNRINFLDKSF